MNLSPHSQGFGADFLTETPDKRSEEALGELLLATRRQIWILALGACLGVTGALFHYATSPKTFEASATLLIEEQMTELEQEISTALPTARNDTSMMNEMQILASLQVASDVVVSLDLIENDAFQNPPSSLFSSWIAGAKNTVRGLIPAAEPATVDIGYADPAAEAERVLMQTAQRLRNSTVFHRVGRSFVVEIWYASHDPALAADIVNAYADAYIQDGIRATVVSTEERARWMEARLEDLRAEAQDAAEAAEQFRLDVGVADQQGLRELEQQAEALNDLVFRFQNRYRELALESSFPASSGRILSRALPPRDPSAPRATHILAAGVFLGLLLGLGVAVLREARETGFRTGGDVTRALGLPFLGYVPEARRANVGLMSLVRRNALRSIDFRRPRKTAQRARELPSRHLADPHDRTTPEGRTSIVPFAASQLDAAFDQAMRGILAGLERPRGDLQGRRIAVGALTPGEDSTEIALALAQQSSRAGRQCLLVDADLAHAGLTRRLGLLNMPGTLNVLDGTAGLDSGLHRTDADDLSILPVGCADDAALSIAYLSEFAELIGDLSDGYDDVIIDLPPLFDTPEARTLLRQADSTVLVVAWGQTSRQLVQSFVEHDPGLRTQRTGIALSRVNLRRLPRYGVRRPVGSRRQSGRGAAKTP